MNVDAGCNLHDGESFVPIDQTLTAKHHQEEIEE